MHHSHADSPFPASAKTSHQIKRLSAILAAAEAVFLEKGFDRGSLDDIAKSAGSSKATIYSHFGSKVGLFKAIMLSRIVTVSQPLKDAEITHAPARDVLTAVGTNFLTTLTSPLALQFYKLIISHGATFPELAHTWFENGPRKMFRTLGDFLSERTAEGELDIQDPETAAELFLMSLRGTLQMQALMKMIEPPFDTAVAQKVSAAVSMFMRAYENTSEGKRESP